MQYGNYCVRGVVETVIQHEAKPSAVSASVETKTTSTIIPVLHELTVLLLVCTRRARCCR